MQGKLQHNARDLERELAWFAEILETRFKLYFGEDAEPSALVQIRPPDFNGSGSDYARFLKHYQPSFGERVALVLALIPHLRPQLLDIFFTKNATFDRPFTEFGGCLQTKGNAFMPTGETLFFILAGKDLETRLLLKPMMDPRHFLWAHGIFCAPPANGKNALIQAPLMISQNYLALLTVGRAHRPEFGADFPARSIETRLNWEDLILHPGTLARIKEIEIWIQYGDVLMNDWQMAPKLRPGYRALFHGPPGTGKTMTACLLGKMTGRDVFQLDISLVVSKYIGETEQNLAKVFDQAQHQGWVLFFDEADALFGKRGQTKDAHDRYANQEISFLLQRVETFDGIVILASNFRENIDPAFARRFETVVHFPMPGPAERLQLWQRGFSPKARLAADLSLEKIAEEYVLSGGSIMNVVRHASLCALARESDEILFEDVQQGIRREQNKEGKAA